MAILIMVKLKEYEARQDFQTTEKWGLFRHSSTIAHKSVMHVTFWVPELKHQADLSDYKTEGLMIRGFEHHNSIQYHVFTFQNDS